MTHPLVVVSVLVAVWVLGWGDLSASNVVSGVLVGLLVILVFPIGRVPERAGHTLRVVAAVRLLGFFVVELVRSNVAMTRDLLGARSRINAGVVVYRLRVQSDGLATFLVNVLSLSPGCMPIDLDEEQRLLYLHLTRMHERSSVLRVVARYEELVVDAFGSPAEREACRPVVPS